MPAMADVPYRDARTVKVPPPPPGGRAADVMVRIRQVQAPAATATTTTRPAPVRPGATLPPPPASDAPVIASAETLATLGTPFYVTTTQGESRIELAGIVSRVGDRADANRYRVQFHVARRAKMMGLALQSTWNLKLGQTLTVGEWPGSVLVLTLEPASAATSQP